MEAGTRAAAGSLRPVRDSRRLFVLSFLMLFVELVLIRWTAANVVYLAYFSNFVLLASFLGIGVGFLRAGSDDDRSGYAALMLAAFVLFVTVFPVGASQAGGRHFAGLFGMFALPIWVSLPLIFIGVAAVMASIAEGVARVFKTFEPLQAYRLDIGGSIVGIAAFSTLSFVGASPIVWALVVAGVFLLSYRPHVTRRQVVTLLALVLLFTVGSLSPHDHWSPYYRVTESSPTEGGIISIKVNGLPHQSIVPIDLLKTQQPFYFQPYEHLGDNPLRNVLVIGAGNGNDVAVALSMGAQHVDAVEIDPVIQSIGRAQHPNHPYEDPRVSAHIGDGRAFLERTATRYDLIIFALPDSLTLVSGQSSLRLESYLFTVESMRSVRDHLSAGGAFTMYNYYRPDVFDRFAATITEAFGHPPCIDDGGGTLGPRQQGVLTVGLAPGDVSCADTWTSGTIRPSVATDDHPFPYLQGRTIPTFYIMTLLLILLGSVVGVRSFGGPLREMRPFVDLFFMGVAFLLLETKSVVQFALLFGTTWFVNALVFAGILLSVLGAVSLAQRINLPRPQVLFGGLALALVAAWAVPQESLLSLALVPRFAAAVGLAFAPVFLANLVFAQRFKDVGSATVAFGANLLGAMVGGVLEYGALVVGYRALLIVVAAMYLLAFLTRRGGHSRALGSFT
ncbi:MAG: spermidine synthase [Actinomycetota bacterium]